MIQSSIRFDDALPRLVLTLEEHLPPAEILQGVIVRDLLGRLAFTCGHAIAEEDLERLDASVRSTVGRYARPQGAVVAGIREGREAAILKDPAAIEVRIGDSSVRLIDRRLSGGDWLRGPKRGTDEALADGVPTVVFASMKGGVGRSTALVVSALDLIDRGRRVLVVDLDVEAPGLGVMLLADEQLPPFGVIDALVERKLGPLDDAFVTDLVAPSGLGGGALLVCPALGARSVNNPENVLSKIGRVYGDTEDPTGARMTLMDQVAELVDALTRVHSPDVVLVDARAGLHELTAATILGLGSEVLLFGLDEAQTWHAYRILLAQLAAGASRDDWSEALTPVQGKAPADVAKRAAFKETWRALLESAAEPPTTSTITSESLPGDQYEWDESAVAPIELRDSTCLAVLYNENFVGFSPLASPVDGLERRVLDATFGDLFDHIRRIVGVA